MTTETTDLAREMKDAAITLGFDDLDALAKSRNGEALSGEVWYEFSTGQWWVHQGRQFAYVNNKADARRYAEGLASGGSMVTVPGLHHYDFCVGVEHPDADPVELDPSDVTVDTGQYEMAHGKHPGMVVGRGHWYFFADERAGLDGPHYETGGTWSTALEAAMEWAAENGHAEISVGT